MRSPTPPPCCSACSWPWWCWEACSARSRRCAARPRHAAEDAEADGLLRRGLAGVVATWSAALLTIGVWSYLVGERRFFRLAQHLLAGLATGYLSPGDREVLLPRLLDPSPPTPAAAPAVAGAGAGAGDGGCALAAAPGGGGASRHPGRRVAAFALSGAVVGTVLPQIAGALCRRGPPAAGERADRPGHHGPGAGGIPAWRAPRPAVVGVTGPVAGCCWAGSVAGSDSCSSAASPCWSIVCIPPGDWLGIAR